MEMLRNFYITILVVISFERWSRQQAESCSLALHSDCFDAKLSSIVARTWCTDAITLMILFFTRSRTVGVMLHGSSPLATDVSHTFEKCAVIYGK